MAYIKGRCEPAYSVIVACGGVCKTATLLGISPGAVSRWLIRAKPGSSNMGTGGAIPARYHPALVTWSQAHQVPISLGAAHQSAMSEPALSEASAE